MSLKSLKARFAKWHPFYRPTFSELRTAEMAQYQAELEASKAGVTAAEHLAYTNRYHEHLARAKMKAITDWYAQEKKDDAT